jgi:hypothetical protein
MHHALPPVKQSMHTQGPEGEKLTLKQAVVSMWRFFANRRFLMLAP